MTDDYNIEYPRADDQLFRGDSEDWQYDALINKSRDSFYNYADGYKDAADEIANLCLNRKGTIDILIYPLTFLYRQYIELRLKEAIIGLNYYLNDINDYPKHHYIDKLFIEFKSLYKKVSEIYNQKHFDNTEKLIKEFAHIDYKSFSFRYPVDKEGNHSLSIDRINIRNLKEVMQRIATFLDAAIDYVEQHKDIAAEMKAEWYSEMQSNYYNY